MAGHILILGGGFIGYALTQRLAESGRTVTVLSRSAPHQPLPDVHWHQGSLNDTAALRSLLAGCNAVVHLATTSTPGTHVYEPAREAQENLLPLLRLLEIMGEHPETPLVYLSTGGAIYGNPANFPVTEQEPINPFSYHAAGKAAAEHFLNAYARQGHNVTILRPANAYGPGQAIKPGFGVVRTLLEHVRRGTPMHIWGDGETVRDYIYIDDLVVACLAVLDNPENGTFNVGSGVGHTLNQLCSIVEHVTECSLPVRYQPVRNVDVQAVVLNYAAFRQHYHWQPVISIQQGVRMTWEWLQQQP